MKDQDQTLKSTVKLEFDFLKIHPLRLLDINQTEEDFKGSKYIIDKSVEQSSSWVTLGENESLVISVVPAFVEKTIQISNLILRAIMTRLVLLSIRLGDKFAEGNLKFQIAIQNLISRIDHEQRKNNDFHRAVTFNMVRRNSLS